MVHINKAVPCNSCGTAIENYSINNNTHLIVFTCPKCNSVIEISEAEYKKLSFEGRLV